MYLAAVDIEGFRGIERASLQLRQGLNILVGENNAGKSSIIEAIRLALSLTMDQDRPRVTSEDFCTRSPTPGVFSVALTFRDLDASDQGRFLEALIGDPAQPEARLGVVASRDATSGRIRVRHWCGASTETPLPTQMAEWIGTAFLQPLRDPTTGLEPGRHSQIGRLLGTITTEAERAQLVGVVSDANGQLRDLAPVVRTQEAMNKTFESVAGRDMRQDAALSFAEPEFEQLRRNLMAVVDGLSVRQNGLGFNNLLFTATVFAALQEDKTYAVRILLVEEPEAHIHPQLQNLLIRFLEEKCGEASAPTQVVFSSHSTHVASAVPIHSHALVSRAAGTAKIRSAQGAGLTSSESRKLMRYLDATRSTLLFARRVVLVEGISEVMLLNRLSTMLGMDLRDRGISVISTEGLNFEVFMKLLGKDAFQMRTAVVTDADGMIAGQRAYPGPRDQAVLSATAEGIQSLASWPVRAFFAQATLEYDLALHSEINVAVALSALADLHPVIAADLALALSTLSTTTEKAAAFHHQCFKKRKVSKPEFIHALLDKLDSSPEWIPPPYLVYALEHVWEP